MKPGDAITLDSAMASYYRANPDRQRAALLALHRTLENGTAEAPAMPAGLATKAEVAKYFQRSTRWVDLVADAGKLPRLRTPGAGKGVRFRWSDVQKLEAEMLVEVAQ